MTQSRRRDGDLVLVGDDVPWHDPRCTDGWLPPMPDERPVPCPVCRPRIAKAQEDRRRRQLAPHRRASPQVQAAAMATIRAELARARLERTEAPR